MPSIEERIIAGELPEEFMERYEIVPPEHLLAQKFAGDTSEILKKLLGSHYDPELHNFRILLSAQEEPNAFVISSANPPIMTFTFGLLKLLSSEDELAAIAAHELTHKRLHDRLGKHVNSKLEEFTADIWPVKTLYEAGYRPAAMAEALRKLPQKRDNSFLAKVEKYIDVHPGTRLRVRVAENAADALMRQKGAVDKAPAPFDAGLMEDIKKFHQPTYMQKLLLEKGFETADNCQKLKIIGDIFETELLDPENPYQGRQVIDLKNALETIHINKENTQEISAFETLVNLVVLKREPRKMDDYSQQRTAQMLYRSLSPVERGRPVAEEPGNVSKLVVAMQNFIDATDIETATQWAREIRLLKEVVDAGDDKYSIVHANRFPHFFLPSQTEINAIVEPNSIPLEWKRHINWAKEDVREGRSPDIQIALAMMGITYGYGCPMIGYNQPPIYPKGNISAIPYSTFGGYFLPTLENSLNSSLLRLSDEGDILGFVPDDPSKQRFWPSGDRDFSAELWEKFEASETARMAERDRRGLEAIQNADWQMLESPGWLADYDRVVKETGYAEDSWSLRTELEKLDWFRKESRYRDLNTRYQIAYIDNEEHTNRISKFIAQHKALLIPESSIVGGGWVFEKEFVDRLNNLAKKNPEIYKPLMEYFFGSGFYSSIKVSMGAGNNFYSWWEEAAKLAKEQGIYDLNDSMGRHAGIDPEHPYMALIKNPNMGIEPYKRTNFLSCTRYLKYDESLSPADRWNFDPVDALGLRHAQKPADLQELSKATLRGGGFCDVVMMAEIYRLVEDERKTFSRDEIVALKDFMPSAYRDNTFAPETRQKLEGAFRKTAEHNLAVNQPIADLVEDYVHFSHYNHFLNFPQLRHEYERGIAKGLASIADSKTRKQLSEQILFSRSIAPVLLPGTPDDQYKCAIGDPDFRKQIINGYVDSLTEIYGKDDGSQHYYDRVKLKIDDVLARTEGAFRFDILSRLAGTYDAERKKSVGMQLQKSLSYYIRDSIPKAEQSKLSSHNLKVVFGEILIDKINSNETLRHAVIDFMRMPLTDETTERFLEQLEKDRVFGSLLSREQKDAEEKKLLGREAKIDAVRQAYRNFWALSLEARTVAFEKILFPIDAKMPDAATSEGFVIEKKKGLSVIVEKNGFSENYSFRTNKDYVLNLMAPKVEEQKPEGFRAYCRILTRRKNPENPSNIKRDFYECYLGRASESEQRLFLTAMLVANEPSANSMAGNESGFGKSLRRILYATGPAGAKIAQSIHSHPSTPDWLRRDFAESKIAADLPERWTIHELVEKNELTGGFSFIGPILGAGAYGITVETDRNDGIKSATTFLRPNVRERAAREFSTFAKAGEDFVTRHSSFGSVLDMIRQAEKMSAVETDMDIAARQAETARSHYDGVAVDADGKVYHFETPRWLGHGRDYKQVGIVQGQHFNDLSFNSAEEETYRMGAAKSLLAVEQRALLSGQAFDHDRHGGQQRIEDYCIGQFDYGAMGLEPPTTHQKALLGRALGSAMRKHILSGKRTSVADALIQKLDSLGKTPSDKEFLIEVKRAFLAQNDFRDALPDKGISVIAAAWTSPDVDPLIHKNMKRALGPLSPVVMRHLWQQASKANIRIMASRAQKHQKDIVVGQSVIERQIEERKVPDKPKRRDLWSGFRYRDGTNFWFWISINILIRKRNKNAAQ